LKTADSLNTGGAEGIHKVCRTSERFFERRPLCGMGISGSGSDKITLIGFIILFPL